MISRLPLSSRLNILDLLRLCCFIFNLVLIKIGIPENEVLEGLARKIPKEWKTLGRRLNMDEAVLDSFHKEEDRCTERAYKMLLKWKQAEGEGATFLMLYNALCHYFVDRKDLAEKFCRA